MIIGTCNFVSRKAAEEYYVSQGYDRETITKSVQGKINEGLIAIGKPALKTGQKLGIDTVEGRYFIDDGKP